MVLATRNALPAGNDHPQSGIESRSLTRRSATCVVVAVLSVMLGACAQLGPEVLKSGRPQYNIAVQQTEAEQLLLNIVRSRYSDPILFLDIVGITSGFSRGVNAGLLGSFSSGSNSGVANAGGNFSENPIITYGPNIGEKFVRQMLTPVDLQTIALLLQAGWSIERIMLLLGESANQLYNRPTNDGTAQSQEGYLEVAAALRDLQRSRRLSVGLERGDNEGETAMILMFDADAINTPAYRVVCEALGGACDGNPLRLKQGFGASTESNTLSLATRSLSSALYHLSRHVDAPRQHVAAGIASATGDFSTGASDALQELFRVYSSMEEPVQAAVKVHYRDTWFYIADNDQDSKTTFALLSILITLKSGDATGIMPIITIPSG